MKKALLIIIISILVVIVIVAYFLWPRDNGADLSAQLEESCQEAQGQWLPEYQECEYASAEWCAANNGEFLECESACRHSFDPEVICTMQCVPVCKLGLSSVSLGQTPESATYYLEDQAFTLDNGQAQLNQGNGESGLTQIKIFGQPVYGDLNGDELEDAVVVLQQANGGTGVFYYLAVALKTAEGYAGTAALFLGDRIAWQNTAIVKGVITVNYADRLPWEDMSSQPSVGKTRYVIVDNDQLVEQTREAPTPEQAKALVTAAWGDCRQLSCQDFSIGLLDGQGGVWYVEATYNDLADDSVKAKRLTAPLHYADDQWTLGDDEHETYLCQPNRGSQEFSADLCL